MKNVEKKHIVVAGAARSGIAVACLLRKKGAFVFVTDNSSISEEYRKRLQQNEIPFEEYGHSERAFKGDFLVTSPGVPDSSPVIRHYIDQGKPVYSEIETASWFNKSPVIAVTGSNGKTTVTNWIAHTWKTANREHILAGNIGTAFSDEVENSSPGREAILEISSFQLDHIDSFHPKVSMILNITPDHLDRYENNFENYSRSKFRIAENQTEEDWFIYNYDDPVIKKFTESKMDSPSSPKMLGFSNRHELDRGAFIKEKNIILKLDENEELLMPFADIQLPGHHNVNNSLAVALAARVSEISTEWIRESLKSFRGVEHRLEPVRKLKGVQYINDSKATNINSVWCALDSFHVPVVLILGGRDKGNDYTKLETQIREKVHTVIAIGEAAESICNQLDGIAPYIIKAGSLKEAVKTARNKAKRGEVVLLSPACSSFDMFKNFEDRGHQFKQAVLEL